MTEGRTLSSVQYMDMKEGATFEKQHGMHRTKAPTKDATVLELN